MSAARPLLENLPAIILTEFTKARPARPLELAKVRKIARRSHGPDRRPEGHICREADYLFLIVPQRRPRGSGKSESVNARVLKRIGTFFKEANYINVEGAFVFAY